MAGVTALLFPVLAGGSTALAADTGHGWTRFAHFAPGKDPVDLYVDGGKSASSVAFQQVTSYTQLTSGPHSVAVRAAGSPASAAPLASTTVTVGGNTASTVAAVTSQGGLAAHVYQDDLASPPAGQARLRVIPTIETVPTVDVFAAPSDPKSAPASVEKSTTALVPAGTAPLFSGAAFAAATPYATVPANHYDVQVTPTGGGQPVVTGRNWPVMAGTVVSIVVLMGPSSSPTIEVVRDAAGAITTPSGGLRTGFGGAAHHATSRTVIWLQSVAAAALLGAALVLVRRQGWTRRALSVLHRGT
jgi:hypothetical protein